MHVNAGKCIGCEECLAICPVGAIRVENGKARILPEVCISCGACLHECWTQAISWDSSARRE